MLNFPPAVRIWLGTSPVDLRRSFDGLAEEVRQHLHNDPLSGHIFVFRNKRGDRVKLLYWDEDGYVIVYKRLEEGVFRWPAAAAGQPSVALRAAELAMLLDGIDWSKAQRGRRYHRPATATATG
jgi:transposase